MQLIKKKIHFRSSFIYTRLTPIQQRTQIAHIIIDFTDVSLTKNLKPHLLCAIEKKTNILYFYSHIYSYKEYILFLAYNYINKYFLILK